MAWTAKITDKSLSEGRLTITVELDNGTQKFGERFVVSNAQSPSWLKDRINEKIRILDQLSTYETSLELGGVDLTPDPDPKPTPPTKDELDRIAFVQEYQKYQQLQKALEAKLITQKDVDDQAVVVKSKYKDDYLDIVSQ